MYKKFFMGIAAMAALTLVSCSSDDLDSLSDNSSKNEAISFDGYLGRSAVAVNGSRGSVEMKETLKTKGFGVFGKYNAAAGQNFGSDLFNNVKVYSSSTADPVKWTYDNTKYWPTQGHIDFLAYAPYVENKTLTGSSIDFNVENKVADQQDLLYAKADGQTMANNSGDNKVKFQFKHALSRLGYSVKLKGKCSSDATITLKKITLSATKPTTGATTEPTTGAFYTNGTIDLSTGKWTPSSGKQDFKWFSAETQESQSITFKSEYNTSTSNKTYTNKDNEYLFVIPQNFSQSGNTLYVIVEYDIKYTNVSETITNKVYQQLTTDFAQGKAYMINLTIGRPIEFNVEVVEGWGDNNPVDIESWDVIK